MLSNIHPAFTDKYRITYKLFYAPEIQTADFIDYEFCYELAKHWTEKDVYGYPFADWANITKIEDK